MPSCKITSECSEKCQVSDLLILVQRPLQLFSKHTAHCYNRRCVHEANYENHRITKWDQKYISFIHPSLFLSQLEALREFRPLPRIFKYYCWLSVWITIVNKEYFKKFLDLDPETLDTECDPNHHQNLITCSFGHASALQRISSKIHS